MNRKLILPLLLIVQIIGLQFLSFFPAAVEKYYSNGLYPIISRLFRSIFGWLPFSFGDLLYGILIIWALFWVFRNRKTSLKSKVIGVVSFISVAYFAFHFLWAFNYYRLPLIAKMNNLESRDSGLAGRSAVRPDDRSRTETRAGASGASSASASPKAEVGPKMYGCKIYCRSASGTTIERETSGAFIQCMILHTDKVMPLKKLLIQFVHWNSFRIARYMNGLLNN